MGRVGGRADPPVVGPERSLSGGMEGRAVGAGRVGGAGGGGTWAGLGTCGGDAGGWTRAGGKSVCCGPRPGVPASLGRPASGVGNVSPPVAFLCYHRLVRKII